MEIGLRRASRKSREPSAIGFRRVICGGLEPSSLRETERILRRWLIAASDGISVGQMRAFGLGETVRHAHIGSECSAG